MKLFILPLAAYEKQILSQLNCEISIMYNRLVVTLSDNTCGSHLLLNNLLYLITRSFPVFSDFTERSVMPKLLILRYHHFDRLKETGIVIRTKTVKKCHSGALSKCKIAVC